MMHDYHVTPPSGALSVVMWADVVAAMGNGNPPGQVSGVPAVCAQRAPIYLHTVTGGLASQPPCHQFSPPVSLHRSARLLSAKLYIMLLVQFLIAA